MFLLKNTNLTRIYDFIISFLLFIFLSPFLALVFIICFFESGKPIFIQKRLGKNQKTFNIIKFRTMKLNTPSLSTHLVTKQSVTNFGKFMRKLKIDELPQLINVINGDMSLIGPRPCLLNQYELIEERKKFNIFQVKPGITGLSQIKGIDMSNPKKLTKTDYLMISNFNNLDYFKYLFLTFFGKGLGDRVDFK